MALQIPNYQEYYQKAFDQLQAYYQRLLTEEGGNVERVKRRLEEDYQRGNRITLEDYTMKMNQASEGHQADTQQHQLTTVQEDRALQDNQLQRGISLGGLAGQQTGEQKSRQELRREAIDRALKNTQQELAYGKERDLEQSALNKLRGGEDTESGWNSFKIKMGQEQEEKALSLAEQNYQRELQRKQAEEQAAQAEKSLKLQQDALNAYQ